MRVVIRRWRLRLRSGQTLTDLARTINAVIQGWINYFGRFHRSSLFRVLDQLNVYLARWAMGKYKRLRAPSRAGLADPGRNLHNISQICSRNWRPGVRPKLDVGSR